jgi:hypothetical protein
MSGKPYFTIFLISYSVYTRGLFYINAKSVVSLSFQFDCTGELVIDGLSVKSLYDPENKLGLLVKSL